MKKIILTMVVILGASVFSHAGVSKPTLETEKAVNAAVEWLDLLDRKLYSESWSISGKVFRENVSSEKWSELMGQVTEKYGYINSRALLDAKFHPDSKTKIAVKYDSVASVSGKILESIVLQNENGKWRVVGYWLK